MQFSKKIQNIAKNYYTISLLIYLFFITIKLLILTLDYIFRNLCRFMMQLKAKSKFSRYMAKV